MKTCHASVIEPQPFARAATAIALAAITSTACSQQPVAYGWSHPMSGEYLFAYDKRECNAQTPETANVQSATQGPFFACMRARGYFLVDPMTGRPLASIDDPQKRANPQALR